MKSLNQYTHGQIEFYKALNELIVSSRFKRMSVASQLEMINKVGHNLAREVEK